MACRSSVHVGRRTPRRPSSSSSSSCSASQVRASSPASTAAPSAPPPARSSIRSTNGSRSPRGPLQRDDAEPDRLDVARREVVEPRGIHRRELGGAAGGDRRRATRSRRTRAGSCTSRCTTQASSPVPSTQPRTRSRQSSRRGTSQLPRNWATPPGSRWSPTERTRSATMASPAAPPSRYSNSGTSPERGVMTNGGLLTISPKRSPATGSSIEPARTSQSALVEGGVEPGERQGPLRRCR